MLRRAPMASFAWSVERGERSEARYERSVAIPPGPLQELREQRRRLLTLWFGVLLTERNVVDGNVDDPGQFRDNLRLCVGLR